MANITPQMVKDLREKTGAGMGDCKKALMQTDGDMQAAIDELRKKGAASAAKRADRSANEGVIFAKTSADGKTGVIVEVNCETDFVAMNAAFVEYGDQVADALLANDASNIDELMSIKVGDDTLLGLHNGILAKFSEKIEVRRFEKIVSDGYLNGYIHAGNKLAVLVDTNVANPSDEAKVLIRDIAMQIAAMNPSFVDRTVVSNEIIEKEKALHLEVAINEGKKPEIAERVAEGKINKFFQETCLIEQAFVKDSNKTIADVLKEISPEAKVNSFRRYFLGESDEK